MPATSRKSSPPTATQRHSQRLVEEIHQALYGSYFEKGLVVQTNEGEIQLTLSAHQATRLYAALGVLINHPDIKRDASDDLHEIRQMLQAARADKTPHVFEVSPFEHPNVFYASPLPAPLAEEDEDDLL